MDKEKKVCGSQLRKKPGRFCQRPPMKGRTRCRIHGGKSLRGAESPSYKTGRHSKYMPEGLLDKYHEASNDPALLSLHSDIALVDTRLADLLTKIDTGESGSLYKRLKVSWKNVRETKDDAAREVALSEHGSLLGLAIKEELVWDDIHKMLDQRNRLVSSERKRYVEMSQVITADRAVMLFAQVAEAIKETVTDKDELRKLTTVLGNLLNCPGSDVIEV